MSFKKHTKNFLFAKKYLQNLTCESIILSIQALKRVGYPSSLLKKCFVVPSKVIYWLRKHFKTLLHLLMTSRAVVSGHAILEQLLTKSG